MERIRRFLQKIRIFYQNKSLQFILSSSLTAAAVVVMVGVSVVFSGRFVETTEKMVINNNNNVLDQMNLNLDNYLHNMISISNAVYYSIIKNTDFGRDGDNTFNEKMRLLYDANSSSLVSMAIFDEDGRYIASQPLSRQKKNVRPESEEWFIKAAEQAENVHFSTPHVENLFVSSDSVYHWVVTLSRSVEVTRDGTVNQGVLIVNMNFTGIEQICKSVDLGESGYVYIVDRNGELIYHPRQQLIYGGVMKENNRVAAGYADGSHMETFEGKERQITVKTVGYTGWKIIGVSPTEHITSTYMQNRNFVWAATLIGGALLILMNMLISSIAANPIKQLERSVRWLENHNLDTPVAVGGTCEIRHLGVTIQNMVENIRKLMDDIVTEQEGKRKSEMDALQSQINPHFLYNTLDSIVWMIENQRYEGAITMVTALASLFRISLSKGKNIIPLEQEIKHAESYLIIQKVRYKNKFEYTLDVEDSIRQCAVIKLIIQPFVENCIYHGMEYMDGEGEILIHAYAGQDRLYIDICDNGPGMMPEQTEALLKGTLKSGRSKGSGIGFYNVQERIWLYFGKGYGLEVESEPDEGTRVRICLPLLSVEEAESGGGTYDK